MQYDAYDVIVDKTDYGFEKFGKQLPPKAILHQSKVFDPAP